MTSETEEYDEVEQDTGGEVRVSRKVLKKLVEADSTYNPILLIYNPLKEFAQDSVRLVNKCTKPDAKEFQKIAIATGVGFVVMGMLGFLIKLIHIPINNILIRGF